LPEAGQDGFSAFPLWPSCSYGQQWTQSGPDRVGVGAKSFGDVLTRIRSKWLPGHAAKKPDETDVFLQCPKTELNF
jgi:hypothetical protein